MAVDQWPIDSHSSDRDPVFRRLTHDDAALSNSEAKIQQRYYSERSKELQIDRTASRADRL